MRGGKGAKIGFASEQVTIVGHWREHRTCLQSERWAIYPPDPAHGLRGAPRTSALSTSVLPSCWPPEEAPRWDVTGWLQESVVCSEMVSAEGIGEGAPRASAIAVPATYFHFY